MAEVVGLIVVVTASAAFVVSQGHDRAGAGPTDSPPKGEPVVVVDGECVAALDELRSLSIELTQIDSQTSEAFDLADHRWDKADALMEGASQLYVVQVKVESLATVSSVLAAARNLIEASVDEYRYFYEQWALGFENKRFDHDAHSHYEKGTRALDSATAELYPSPC